MVQFMDLISDILVVNIKGVNTIIKLIVKIILKMDMIKLNLLV